MSVWILFKLIGALALLMFGMKSMSESLQKMAGPQLRHVLGAMTTNRFTGILTGTFITAARAIINRNDGDDGEFCECRTPNPCASHIGYHGCKHRNDAYGMDHVSWFLV